MSRPIAALRVLASLAACILPAAAFSQRTIQSRLQFGFTAEFKRSLLVSLDPKTTATPRFYARVSVGGGATAPPAPGESVLFTPSFPQPMYESQPEAAVQLGLF